MKMIITYLAGFICGIIFIEVIAGFQNPVGAMILIVLLTSGSFYFCHKVHKRKQTEYRNRFKNLD